MRPNAYPQLSFDLGETADMLRRSVADFTAAEIGPRAADIDATNEFPMDLWRIDVGVDRSHKFLPRAWLAHR